MALQEEIEKQGNFLFRYRSYFPIIFLLSGITLYLKKELNPSVATETLVSALFEKGGMIICLIGFAIRIYTVGYSSDRTSGRNILKQSAESLNTTGLYSIVRHPLYLGNFFIWLGICMYIRNLFFLALFFLIYWLYYERIMYSEEQFLRRKFGDSYLDWADRTPAFIPKFRIYVRPDNQFDLRRVLRKEQDGFVAIIFIFSFFEIIGNLFREKRLVSADLHWYILFFSGLLVYLILKILKKKTNLLRNNLFSIL